MATEKRLIDANALLISETFTVSEGACKECENEYRLAIQEAPTVDAVEVVRCKDCEWYDPDCETCNFWAGVRHPEHFCGEGERRTDV